MVENAGAIVVDVAVSAGALAADAAAAALPCASLRRSRASYSLALCSYSWSTAQRRGGTRGS